MNPELSNLLEQLHDVRTPAPVSPWPPAFGWWLVLLLVVILFAALVWWLKNRRRSMKKIYLRELQKLRVDFTVNQNKDLLLQNISIFLRRVVNAIDADKIKVAGSTGAAWLAYLDQTGKTNEFTQGAGRILADGPYRRGVDYNPDQLLTLVQQWLVKLP